MAAISTWSTTAASNNQATPDGFPEGQNPGSLNDCARTMMAAIRSWYEGAQWIDYGHTPTKTSSNTFTVSGDQTAIYDAGRRLKFSGSASGYDTIASSSYSAPNTTVTLTASPISGTLTAVAVGIISGTNKSIDLSSYATIASGSFTATLTGMIGSTTGTINYVVAGGLCSLRNNNGGGSILGTSNSTSMTMTGLPAACQPAGASIVVPCTQIVDVGNFVSGEAQIAGNVITFAPSKTNLVTNFVANLSTAFTNSGSKGLGLGWSITYPIA